MARSLLLLSLLLLACNNLEDANVPDRKTFIRFFGSSRSYSSAVVERDAPDVGGYILVGNIAPKDATTQAAADSARNPAIIVIKTDDQGNKLWEFTYPKANVSAVKPLGKGSTGDGYLLTGEGIDLNPSSPNASEFVNTQFLLLKIVHGTGDATVVQKFKKDSTITGNLHVDFEASSTVSVDANQIATLGSYKVPGGQQKTITMGFDLADITTPTWRKNLDLVNFDYVNTPFLGMSGANLVWASTASPTDVNESKYLSVIAVPPDYASPSNNSLFGLNKEGGHDVKDFQPSATGFAAVGTYTSKSGNKNAFFVKVDQAGNVMPGTVQYFDCAATGPGIIVTDATVGVSQDDGTAIAYTSDGGFVLACSMAQTPERGIGGTDIVLIKIDAFGNYKWDKLLGGGGNEVATSIRELPDGTLLISGTSTISNVSSMFIIRADANGDLKE